MKLDEKTLKVLTNYASINKTFYFIPGTSLVTTTITNTIHARAAIKNTIPREFATHDLPKLIGVLKLFKEPDLDWEKNGEGDVLVIREGDRLARFTLSDPHLIHKPSNKEVRFAHDIPFKLPSDTVQELKNAASSFGHTDLVFQSDHGKIIVETTISANPTADRYRTAVGKTNKAFRASIKLSNFLLVSDDYEAAVCFFKVKDKQSGAVYFKGPDIEYYIAIDPRDLLAPKEVAHAA